MAKKKDCLLNSDQDIKIDNDPIEDSSNAVVGSTSNDALLTQNNPRISDSLPENACFLEINANNNNVKNTKVENEFRYQTDVGAINVPVQRSTVRCPWRGIAMAVVLLLFGSLLIISGIALLSDAFPLKGLDNVTPYLILVFGVLCFIPGAYHLLVACCALRGNERFSLDDIPYFG